MQKSILLTIAGVVVLAAGCRNDDVLVQRHYLPAPQETPTTVAAEPLEPVAETVTAPEEQQKPRQAFTYEPMTGVKSSGGVDSVSGASGKAAAAKSAAGKKYYVVKRGDYPERIARRHKVRVSALLAANNLDQESARRLQIGQKLIIPTGAAANVRKSSKVRSAVVRKKAVQTPATVSADGTYTIKSGDTPERVARRFKVKLSDLLKVNNLDEASARRLQIGQKLNIPGRSAASASTAATAETVTTAAETTVSTTTSDYTVTADTAAATTAAATIVTDTAVTDSGATVTTTVDDASLTTATAATDTADTAAAADEPQLKNIEVLENTTMTELAAKLGIPVEKIRNLNQHKSENLSKGEWIFVPNN